MGEIPWRPFSFHPWGVRGAAGLKRACARGRSLAQPGNSVAGDGSATPNEPAGETVPKAALDARVATFRQREEAQQALITHLEAENAQARTALAAAAAQPAAASSEPRVYTRGQLDQLVERGDITETQRDAYLGAVEQKQREEETRAQVAQQFNAHQTLVNTNAAIQAYVDTTPALMTPGSPQRTRVEAVHRELVQRGLPNDSSTELLALEREFGSISQVQERTRQNRETDQPAGGGGDGEGPGSQPSADGVPADMRPETKALYDNQIALGRYSGYDDPVFLKEWGYASARQKR